jgi:hypothetical protein
MFVLNRCGPAMERLTLLGQWSRQASSILEAGGASAPSCRGGWAGAFSIQDTAYGNWVPNASLRRPQDILRKNVSGRAVWARAKL